MAKKYQPAIFQPTIRPDWGGSLSYIPDSEKSEILVALLKYPSVECKSAFWNEVIKPDLDLQMSNFMNCNAVKARGALNRWGKISIPYPNHMDTISTPCGKDMDKNSNPYGIDTKREKEREDKSKSIEEKGHIDWDDVLDRWNRIAKKYGLAVIKVLTEDRKKRFKARLEENKITQVQFFDVVNKAIGTSSFLQGYEIQFESDGTPNKVSQNWKADFDFCLQSSSFARMSENFYSRRSPELLKQWENMENANKN